MMMMRTLQFFLLLYWEILENVTSGTRAGLRSRGRFQNNRTIQNNNLFLYTQTKQKNIMMMMKREYETIFFTKRKTKASKTRWKQKLQIYFLTNCKEEKQKKWWKHIMKTENFNKKIIMKSRLFTLMDESSFSGFITMSLKVKAPESSIWVKVIARWRLPCLFQRYTAYLDDRKTWKFACFT